MAGEEFPIGSHSSIDESNQGTPLSIAELKLRRIGWKPGDKLTNGGIVLNIRRYKDGVMAEVQYKSGRKGLVDVEFMRPQDKV